MEGLGLMARINREFWYGKRVFLTGHTGFKGSWLCLWLSELGAEVYGFALPPQTDPSLYLEANVEALVSGTYGDVRSYADMLKALTVANPEIVIHMAAQPLVRHSYQNPVETYETNVIGTVHLLEAVRQVASVKVILNVTTDKCYENREWCWPYRENEAMGGHDPYSSSKACSELVTGAYRRSFFDQMNVAIATARSGNVIGGGDWSQDRLIPDILRAIDDGQEVVVRNPESVRPWQHVLEPLSGYLMLVERLYTEGREFAGAWNFGPYTQESKQVIWIVKQILELSCQSTKWRAENNSNLHEAGLLKLDISKSETLLGWKPQFSLNQALMKVMEWHDCWRNNGSVRDKCMEQINEFMSL